MEGAATVGEVAWSRILDLTGVDHAAIWVGLGATLNKSGVLWHSTMPNEKQKCLA